VGAEPNLRSDAVAAAVANEPRRRKNAPPLTGAAVVGLGYWGPNWVRNLHQLQCASRLVCCDLDNERRQNIRRHHPGVRVTADLDDVLGDREIEAVVVATPVSTHFEVARRCLAAGKSVLVEKPLAMSRRHTAELSRLARETGRTLMVGHTFEYSAPVRKARDLIKSGELGDIFYISSVRANLGVFQRDINVVWDLGTHDISIILLLLGEMPYAVSCQGQSHCRTNIEDVALLTLHFSDKRIAFIHVSWLDPNKIRRTTIVGSRKMLVYDDTALQEKIRVYDKGVAVLPYYDSFGDFQLSYRYGDINIPLIEETEPLRVECEHFVHCIKTGTVPDTDGASAMRVVSVLEAAAESLHNGGQAVQVDRDPVIYNE
jgi:predicted dehydrogenase